MKRTGFSFSVGGNINQYNYYGKQYGDSPTEIPQETTKTNKQTKTTAMIW